MSHAGEALPIDDCWNHIGVRGDQTCVRLKEFLHCRNCPVFAEAARHIRQRNLPDDYRREWAAHFASAAIEADRADHSQLVFRLGQEWLALPTVAFDSVAEPSPIHRLPHRSSPLLLGIVNVDGQLMPCVSLAQLFGASLDSPQPVTLINQRRRLVLRAAGQHFAFHVDALHGIARHAKGDMKPPPANVNKGLQRYLNGVVEIDALVVGCLDLELVGFNLSRAMS